MSIYPPVREELTRLLSQPRLAGYKQATGGKLEDALRLYTWNLSASAAFFESIHYFEFALRNTLDAQLSDWAAKTLQATQPWYRDQRVPLTRTARQHVATATTRATDNGSRQELPGRVVAELSFGFWWSLLAENYNRTLWQPCLRHAFVEASVRRQRLHSAVEAIRRLRNRIAHHEPVHGRDLAADYVQLLDTSERIHPRLAWWIDTTSRVPTVLQHKPGQH